MLSIAETIIIERGAAALTVSTLADAAGITKGGVQSCFATKELLIRALLDRWLEEEEERFQHLLQGGKTLAERVIAHAKVTQDGGVGNARSASILIALLQSPRYLDICQDWYQKRFNGLEKQYSSEPQLLVALLAIEGAYFLRYFGLYKMSPALWDRSFQEIQTLLSEEPAAKK